MQMLLVLFIVVAFATSYGGSIARNVSNYQATAEATATGDNMKVYQGFLKTYATANPTVTGPVADTAIPLPTWFSHGPTVQNYVSSGKVFVYNTAPPVGLVGYLAGGGTASTITAGVATNGVLVGPTTFGQTPITLPAAIPNNSVVLAN
ncbi:type IV pilus biogenesis protein PilM [Paraburkholderia sp. Se-20369]|nr:type IV pilus biogenesis protein PilM [Paraburkholderia sp. Se-20369]